MEAVRGSLSLAKRLILLLLVVLCGFGCQRTIERSTRREYHNQDSLEARCKRAAYVLGGQLDDDFLVLSRPPFLVAGNADQALLLEQYESRILPAERAISKAYSISKPTNPIALILCQTESSYLDVSRRLFGIQQPSSYGYYRPTERTLVVNEASGEGAISHELTHALFDQDWPDMPIWLNEGIAALHEACRFTNESPWIHPEDNWRLAIAKASARKAPAGIVKHIISETDFKNDLDGSKYASVRYFAWYLHDQGCLANYSQTLRAANAERSQRLSVEEQTTQLCAVLEKTLEGIERDFKKWLELRSG